MADGSLHKYFLNNPSKRLHKWTHYFDIYERHFERFRTKSPTASTDYIAIYDSVVVFEKRPQGNRQAPITAGLSFQ